MRVGEIGLEWGISRDYGARSIGESLFILLSVGPGREFNVEPGDFVGVFFSSSLRRVPASELIVLGAKVKRGYSSRDTLPLQAQPCGEEPVIVCPPGSPWQPPLPRRKLVTLCI